MAEKSLITGISGFIAGNLANTLVRDGQDVIGTGRSVLRPLSADPACQYVPLDINDFDAVCRVIREQEPTTVYHLAAHSVLTAAMEPGPRFMLETNVGGTLNLLEACRRYAVPTIVVASSDKQYGALAAPPYDDEDSMAFLNGGVYELSKAQQDQTARLYAGLFDVPAVRVARLCNIYGPGDTQWTRIVPGP
jgi:CDP-glucose 4,6-dehydratase